MYLFIPIRNSLNAISECCIVSSFAWSFLVVVWCLVRFGVFYGFGFLCVFGWFALALFAVFL